MRLEVSISDLGYSGLASCCSEGAMRHQSREGGIDEDA